MSGQALLIALFGIQLGLVLLDLAEWRRTRGAEPLHVGTTLFLLAVIGVYGLVQYGGSALLPGLDDQVQAIRDRFARLRPTPFADDELSGAALAALAVGTFYLAGLWDYLMHRYISHSRPFWFTHEYHHLPTRVSTLMPGIAGRPFAAVATFPVTVATVGSVYAGLALLGLPLWDVTPLQVVVLAQVTVGTASHSSGLRRWWWVHHALRRLALTTPQEHVLHHARDRHGNYGNFTTLWDRLFGTYLDPTRPEHQGCPLGLAYDQDFLGTLTLGLWRLPDRWRTRFQLGRFCNLHPRRLNGLTKE